MISEEWDSESSLNRASRIAGEVQLKKYGKLLEQYNTQLHNIEKSFIDSSIIISNEVVGLKYITKERVDLIQLVNTDNKVFNKVISVLAALCNEVKQLQDDSHIHYNMLLHCDTEHDIQDNGSIFICIGKFLPKLQELSCFVTRCQSLVVEIVKQLSVLYPISAKNKILNSESIHFEDMMDHLGDLLVTLITLDELIASLDKIHENWDVYKRLIKTVQLDVEKKKIVTFENVIKELEITIVNAKIFQNTIDKCREIKDNIDNSTLSDEFNLYFKNMLSLLESKTCDILQLTCNYSSLWIKLNCLFALNFHLFGFHDKKILRQYWDMCKRISCVNLVGNVVWFPDKFLMQYLSHIMKQEDQKLLQTIVTIRLELLESQTQNLLTDVTKYTSSVSVWLVQLKTILKQDGIKLKFEVLKQRCKIFLKGLLLAKEINTRLKCVMNLHAALGKAMTKTTVLSLCGLIEILKSIESMYQYYYFEIANSIYHVLQYLAYQTLTTLSSCKKRVTNDKSYSQKYLDTLSAIVLAEKILVGPITYERHLIARLALSIARGDVNKIIHDDEVEIIYTNLKNLDSLQKLQSSVKTTCDVSFLYLHRVLLPVYFQSMTENKNNCEKLSYLLKFTSDTECQLMLNGDETFKKETFDNISKYYVNKLCHEIETELRLQVHSHLHKDENIFKVGKSKDFIKLTNMEPIKLFDTYVSVIDRIENYLDTTFYNLTTVALHDWKTYGEMRCLADLKYQVKSVKNHLPYQTLEQGLDVLEIMRNIHIFVSKYLYNLNNQIFIEQSSNNKHLNTINIRHISNSIRMHGIGIMNTTVNFTYQFLRKKFYIFSQFLFDEQIKSRLTKDLLYFREHKSQNDQKFSFEKADKFNKGIRKLGLTDGLSYLDQFRILISQIGNAMGYIRMIRSGGMHCCSKSLNFIPDLEDLVNYEEMTVDDGFSESTCKSARILDNVINDLTKNFTEGTQYFKLLVNVFTNDFRDPKNNHLQNFYVIIPALTLNFVEYIIAAKDKLNRRNKIGATFTDDGFAMGVAYILQLLEQNKQLESLHWFESVREKFIREKNSLIKTNTREENLKTTMLLTAKRLDTFQQEFDLLYFSLNSARIFFQKQVGRELS